MASTSPTELAAQVLDLCLAGDEVPDELLAPLIEQASGDGPRAVQASAALFGGVVEPLADRFEPALCDAYADLFSRVLGSIEDTPAGVLRERYQRVRAPRRWQGPDPERVVVLSRVTLGADIAITSVILNGLQERFPRAEILLAGGLKSWELFSGDPRVGRLDVRYPRSGALADRLAAGRRLRDLLEGAGTLVVDPDSRLTQLGLLPVCEESSYCFFESRAAGGDGEDSLTQLTGEWMGSVFEVKGAETYIALPRQGVGRRRRIAVSFGVGENAVKRIADPFEPELLRGLADVGPPVLIDKGPGGEEADRVARAVQAAGGAAARIEVFEGSFSDFAVRIAGSVLYVGYDSAGQHAAAACGTPAVTIFAGYPSERFRRRWSPPGKGKAISLRLGEARPEDAVGAVLAAVRRQLSGVA